MSGLKWKASDVFRCLTSRMQPLPAWSWTPHAVQPWYFCPDSCSALSGRTCAPLAWEPAPRALPPASRAPPPAPREVPFPLLASHQSLNSTFSPYSPALPLTSPSFLNLNFTHLVFKKVMHSDDSEFQSSKWKCFLRPFPQTPSALPEAIGVFCVLWSS